MKNSYFKGVYGGKNVRATRRYQRFPSIVSSGCLRLSPPSHSTIVSHSRFFFFFGWWGGRGRRKTSLLSVREERSIRREITGCVLFSAYFVVIFPFFFRPPPLKTFNFENRVRPVHKVSFVKCRVPEDFRQNRMPSWRFPGTRCLLRTNRSVPWSACIIKTLRTYYRSSMVPTWPCPWAPNSRIRIRRRFPSPTSSALSKNRTES